MVPMSFKEIEIDVFVPFVGNVTETLEFLKTSDQKDEFHGSIKERSTTYTFISENITVLDEGISRKTITVL